MYATSYVSGFHIVDVCLRARIFFFADGLLAPAVLWQCMNSSCLCAAYLCAVKVLSYPLFFKPSFILHPSTFIAVVANSPAQIPYSRPPPPRAPPPPPRVSCRFTPSLRRPTSTLRRCTRRPSRTPRARASRPSSPLAGMGVRVQSSLCVRVCVLRLSEC